MRDTRSSSVSFSIETEADSIEISPPASKTGKACSTVMSSSISSSGKDSQTIARDAGRSGLTGALGLDTGADSSLAFAAGAGGLEAAGAGLETAAGAGLEVGAGGRSVSLSLGETLALRALLAGALERRLPNANQASKNAAKPVSAGATSCELSSTIRLP